MTGYKTYATRQSDIQREWLLVDAKGQTLGRLATHIATLLRGKHKPTFAPYLDMGDYVIVVNADKIHVTRDRMESKIYYRATGYLGNLKSTTLGALLRRHPDRPLRLAIKRMLPKGALGHQMMGKLKIYAGEKHPHEAQKPRLLVIDTRNRKAKANGG